MLVHIAAQLRGKPALFLSRCSRSLRAAALATHAWEQRLQWELGLTPAGVARWQERAATPTPTPTPAPNPTPAPTPTTNQAQLASLQLCVALPKELAFPPLSIAWRALLAILLPASEQAVAAPDPDPDPTLSLTLTQAQIQTKAPTLTLTLAGRGVAHGRRAE